MRHLLLGFALLAPALASCGPQVTALGPHRPAHPAGCTVEVVPGTPAFPVVDLAAARAKCIGTARGDCLAALRAQACAAGGDTVYGLTESEDQHVTSMTATLVARSLSNTRPAGSSASEPDAAACVPICSPGFDCQGGRCIPLCNPACGPSEICNMHRTCEPAPTPPAPPAPGVPPA